MRRGREWKRQGRVVDSRIQSVLAELRRRLENLYRDRLVGLVLYGSRARGDSDPDSDVDVLVVLKAPVDPGAEIARTGEIVTDVSLESNMVLSCLFVSEEDFLQRKSPLLLNIRREGLPV